MLANKVYNLAPSRAHYTVRQTTTRTSKKSFASLLGSNAQVIRYERNGNPEEVLKVTTEKLPTSLKENEVAIKMLASPINPADLNMVEGNYGIRPTLPAVGGNEGVGIVTDVGSNVKGLKVNDRVIPLKPGLGTWRTAGIFNADHFHAVPADIVPEYGATVSVNPCTAYRLLEDFVKLQPGDVLIQNGSNSMVGSSVIQLARDKGIKTINIVRNRPDFDEVVERLKSLGGYIVVSEDYALTPQFKRVISDLPKPKLALNCVGGSSATELVRNLGQGGVMVTYGGMSRRPVQVPTGSFIFNDVTLKGFWLSKWIEEHPLSERAAMLDDLFSKIRDKKLKLWMETWKFSQFNGALARLKEPRSRKIVLKMDE